MKILGSIFIICASIYASYLYERKQKNIIRCQSDLLNLICHIKSQIEYFSKPINEILEAYDSKNPFITDILKRKETADFSIFDNNLKKELVFLLKSLGKSYKKEQISLCDYTINLLNASLDNLKSEYTKKCKIYRSISLFFGVCAIVLLI